MEFYIGLDYVSLYIDNLYPNGVGIDVPTWLLFGTIALVYSIKLIRKDK